MRSKLFLKCLKKYSRAIFEFFCLARLRLNTYQIVFVRLLLITSSDRLCYELRSLRILALYLRDKRVSRVWSKVNKG